MYCREITAEKFKVVANLPYYTPIIMRLLEERLPIELIVTMVQKKWQKEWWQVRAARNMALCQWLYSIILSRKLCFWYRQLRSYLHRQWSRRLFAVRFAGTAGGKVDEKIFSDMVKLRTAAAQNIGKYPEDNRAY